MVDVQMAPWILRAWQSGILTSYSCQGDERQLHTQFDTATGRMEYAYLGYVTPYVPSRIDDLLELWGWSAVAHLGQRTKNTFYFPSVQFMCRNASLQRNEGWWPRHPARLVSSPSTD